MTGSSGPSAYPDPARPSGGSAGVAALVLGLVLVLIGLGQQVVGVFMPAIVGGMGLDYTAIGVFYAVVGILTALLAVVTVVVGIVGVQPGRPRGRLAAAAGLALGGAHLASAVVGLATPLLVGAIA